jgi:hypothetical protein
MDKNERQDQLMLKFMMKGLPVKAVITMTEKELRMKVYTLIGGKYYLLE